MSTPEPVNSGLTPADMEVSIASYNPKIVRFECGGPHLATVTLPTEAHAAAVVAALTPKAPPELKGARERIAKLLWSGRSSSAIPKEGGDYQWITESPWSQADKVLALFREVQSPESPAPQERIAGSDGVPVYTQAQAVAVVREYIEKGTITEYAAGQAMDVLEGLLVISAPEFYDPSHDCIDHCSMCIRLKTRLAGTKPGAESPTGAEP